MAAVTSGGFSRPAWACESQEFCQCEGLQPELDRKPEAPIPRSRRYSREAPAIRSLSCPARRSTACSGSHAAGSRGALLSWQARHRCHRGPEVCHAARALSFLRCTQPYTRRAAWFAEIASPARPLQTRRALACVAGDRAGHGKAAAYGGASTRTYFITTQHPRAAVELGRRLWGLKSLHRLLEFLL